MKANDHNGEVQGNNGIKLIPRTSDETELDSSRDFVTANGFDSKIVEKKKKTKMVMKRGHVQGYSKEKYLAKLLLLNHF